MKSEIAIHHHLGLGDIFECNGMIRYYAERYDKVHTFSKKTSFDMISYMYRDNENIILHEVPNDNEFGAVSDFLSNFQGTVLIPGHQDYLSNLSFFSQKQWGPAEAFYHLANVPWECRNSKFCFRRDLTKEQEAFKKLNPGGEKYIFVHDDPSRGFEIQTDSQYKVIKNDPSINMLHLVRLLENAEEIHCMSSSVLCLIDCLSTNVKFPKLYLHYNIRKVKLGPNSLLGNWEYV
jgi:hypothetical protein